jgi:hypothetical protein
VAALANWWLTTITAKSMVSNEMGKSFPRYLITGTKP